MKIGIIQSVIGSGGGNDKVLVSLLNKLKDTEHVVTVYTIGHPRMDLKKLGVKKIKRLFPIKIPMFGIYQKMLEPFLARKAQHEDILLALTGDLFLPANKNQKLIFYSQNNYSDPTKTDTSKYKDGFWKYYYLPYKKMVKNFKDVEKYNVHFLANSNHVKEQLKKGIGVDADILYPPVELEKFPRSNIEKKGIISVGRFSKEKNFGKIIEYTKELDCPKKLFGSVTEINKPYFRELIKMGKPYDFTFYTNQHYDLMLKLLQKSKVFISTSDETFGIAVVEAISAGCIPIVPDSTAHRETVPFPLLRPSDENLTQRIKESLDGKYDYLQNELQTHIKKFDEKVFQNKFLEYIEK